MQSGGVESKLCCAEIRYRQSLPASPIGPSSTTSIRSGGCPSRYIPCPSHRCQRVPGYFSSTTLISSRNSDHNREMTMPATHNYNNVGMYKIPAPRLNEPSRAARIPHHICLPRTVWISMHVLSPTDLTWTGRDAVHDLDWCPVTAPIFQYRSRCNLGATILLLRYRDLSVQTSNMISHFGALVGWHCLSPLALASWDLHAVLKTQNLTANSERWPTGSYVHRVA